MQQRRRRDPRLRRLGAGLDAISLGLNNFIGGCG
jgi:hypothetical protein